MLFDKNILFRNTVQVLEEPGSDSSRFDNLLPSIVKPSKQLNPDEVRNITVIVTM